MFVRAAVTDFKKVLIPIKDKNEMLIRGREKK